MKNVFGHLQNLQLRNTKLGGKQMKEYTNENELDKLAIL